MTAAGPWGPQLDLSVARLDPPAQALLGRARDEADGLGHPRVGAEHLVLAALRGPDGPVREQLVGHGMAYEFVRDFVDTLGAPRRAPGPVVGGTPADDVVAAAIRAVAQRPDDEGTHAGRLVEHVLRAPGGVVAALLVSYAVEPGSIHAARVQGGPSGDARRSSTDGGSGPSGVGSDAAPGEDAPQAWRDASDLARRVLQTALREHLTPDGIAEEVLRLDRTLGARASLALTRLDAEPPKLIELVDDGTTPGRGGSGASASTPGTPDALAVAEAAARWLPRTGDDGADTAHLLLAVLDVAPRGWFARALRVYGVTDDLLVGAAADVRAEVGPADRPGRSATAADGVRSANRRGPTPVPESSPHEVVGRRRGVRWRRRMLRGQSTTGRGLGTDLQMNRTARWIVATSVRGLATLAVVLVVVSAAISTQRWWVLAVLAPFVWCTPVTVPVAVWLAATVAVGVPLPWAGRAALVVAVASWSYEVWVELQWRRADVGDPTYGLRRLRRDIRTSNRALLLGGS